MNRFLLAILVLPLSVSAQSRVGAYLGANFPTASYPLTTDDRLAEFWYPAINLGVYYELPVIQWFEVCPAIEYNHYFFDKFHETISPPTAKQSSGDVSRILRVLIEVRLVDHALNGDRAYLVTGFGYVAEKLGGIRVQWIGEGSGEYSSAIQYPSKDYWVHSLGVGYQFDIATGFAIDLSAKYYSNYKDRFTISTNVGVAYSLQH